MFAAISKVAGCSSVANPSASLGRVGVCARTGNAIQVESPTTAARRVTLMVISGCSKAPGEMAIDLRYQNDACKVKVPSSFVAGKRSTAQTSRGSDGGANARHEHVRS